MNKRNFILKLLLTFPLRKDVGVSICLRKVETLIFFPYSMKIKKIDEKLKFWYNITPFYHFFSK